MPPKSHTPLSLLRKLLRTLTIWHTQNAFHGNSLCVCRMRRFCIWRGEYKDAEENYGSDLLNLVVAKGYLTKLLGNDAVKSYITRHEPEILEHFELVVNTVSMEEAVQQQLEADGEFEDDPDSNDPPAVENTPFNSENDNETQAPGDNAATK